jgi:hypothetical protein
VPPRLLHLRQVTVISTSERKRDEACSRLGADRFLVSSNPDEMAAAAGTLDGIIDTVSGEGRLLQSACCAAYGVGSGEVGERRWWRGGMGEGRGRATTVADVQPVSDAGLAL